MTSIEKNAQGCPGGTRQILNVDTPYYQFQQKNCIYTQLDGQATCSPDYRGRRLNSHLSTVISSPVS